MTEFGKYNETKGFWFFNENGMLWPPVPAREAQGGKMAELLGLTYGVDAIELIVWNDKLHFYCDEEGRINGKHQSNTAFGQQLFGPMLFASAKDDDGNDDDDGSDAPIEWSTLVAALSRTHHSSGWPLLRSEKAKKKQKLIQSKTLAHALIPDDVWQAMWPPLASNNATAAVASKEDGDNVAAATSLPKRKAEDIAAEDVAAEGADAKKQKKTDDETSQTTETAEKKEKETTTTTAAAAETRARAPVDSDAETEGEEPQDTHAKSDEKQTTAPETCDAWFHAPTMWNGKPLPITAARVEAEDKALNHYKCGALVRRERIVQYPKGTLIDTVSFTILTVEGSMQRPMAIAHFAQDGTLVRAQVNCFAAGVLPDDGSYFEEFAEELAEDKKEGSGPVMAFARL